jgi:hypothetical protein
VCLLLASLGLLVLVRGTEATWRSRKVVARRRWQIGGRLAVAGFFLAAVALGGAFFYNANVLNAYTEVHKAEKLLKDWEVTYKPLAGLAQPRVIAYTVRQDFFPERRSSAWRGTMTAVNRTNRPVDTLFLALPATDPRPMSLYEARSNSGLAYDTLAFNRRDTLILDDTRRGVRLYRFTPPLAPGDTVALRFAGRLEPPGYPNDAFNHDVSPNGSFMAYTSRLCGGQRARRRRCSAARGTQAEGPDEEDRRSDRARQQLYLARRRLDHVRRDDVHEPRSNLDRAGLSRP